MTRVFFFDENGTFFLKEDPSPSQDLKGKIINRTWSTDVQLPWADKPIVVHKIGNTILITPPGFSDEGPEVPVPSLTARENEILESLADGLGYKEISQRLSISPLTVKSYVTALKKKLNADTSINTVARAVALGLYRPKFDQNR